MQKENKYKLITIKKSEKADKKMVATFQNTKTGRVKRVHFGAKGMSDYTIHKDLQRKNAYIQRHSKKENWDDPVTAGALSRWILWNKPTLQESIEDYEKKFF